MIKSNVALAEAYYRAMAEKNIHKMGTYLHQDAQLIGPLGITVGKEMILHAAEQLASQLKTIVIRGKFDLEDQAMLAYDMDFDGTIGLLRAAALLTFKDNLIIKNELFFDAHPFKKQI